MFVHRLCLVFVSAVVANGEPAWEIDARIVDRSQGSVSSSNARVLFTRRHLKIGLPDSRRGKTDLLHDQQTGNCRLLSHARKSYAQINTRAVTAVGDAARRLEDVIREGVGRITGTAPAVGPALRVEKSGQAQQVSGMPCHRFTVRHGETLVQEIWATSWTQAGIEGTDVEALRDLAKAMDQPALTSLLGLAFDGRYSLTESMLRIDSYPVIFVQYENGKPVCQVRMGKPKRIDVSMSEFRCPPSYRLDLPPMP